MATYQMGIVHFLLYQTSCMKRTETFFSSLVHVNYSSSSLMFHLLQQMRLKGPIPNFEVQESLGGGTSILVITLSSKRFLLILF
jgi:hypothetical protein